MGFYSQKVGQEKTNDCDEVTLSWRVLITCRLCGFALDVLYTITAWLPATCARHSPKHWNGTIKRVIIKHGQGWLHAMQHHHSFIKTSERMHQGHRAHEKKMKSTIHHSSKVFEVRDVRTCRIWLSIDPSVTTSHQSHLRYHKRDCVGRFCLWVWNKSQNICLLKYIVNVSGIQWYHCFVPDTFRNSECCSNVPFSHSQCPRKGKPVQTVQGE